MAGILAFATVEMTTPSDGNVPNIRSISNHYGLTIHLPTSVFIESSADSTKMKEINQTENIGKLQLVTWADLGFVGLKLERFICYQVSPECSTEYLADLTPNIFREVRILPRDIYNIFFISFKLCFVVCGYPFCNCVLITIVVFVCLLLRECLDTLKNRKVDPVIIHFSDFGVWTAEEKKI